MAATVEPLEGQEGKAQSLAGSLDTETKGSSLQTNTSAVQKTCSSSSLSGAGLGGGAASPPSMAAAPAVGSGAGGVGSAAVPLTVSLYCLLSVQTVSASLRTTASAAVLYLAASHTLTTTVSVERKVAVPAPGMRGSERPPPSSQSYSRGRAVLTGSSPRRVRIAHVHVLACVVVGDRVKLYRSRTSQELLKAMLLLPSPGDTDGFSRPLAWTSSAYAWQSLAGSASTLHVTCTSMSQCGNAEGGQPVWAA